MSVLSLGIEVTLKPVGMAPSGGFSGRLSRMGALALGTFVRSHKRLSAIIGLIALAIALVEAWSVAAPLRGQIAARSDVRHGHYKILSYGLPPSWLPEGARLLRERYGVELRPVAGCIVSKALVSYVDSYDEVSAAAVIRKLGRDVFKECEEDARRGFERRVANGSGG